MAVTLGVNTTFAQKTDTVNVGTATGLLRDSVHNYVMQSATLSVYKVKGDELITYQLSNNFGKFQIKGLPVGIPLRILATHVGYLSTKNEFTISPKTKTIDLKTMNMNRIDLSLKEVTISAAQAPMQMHGDTLEFNASAFKLDSNAVVEELLRKLPGVTVWSDGVITVNGKKINRLLVDGKDFFGGDTKIALQNIPKNSVQKIQVYKNKEDVDPVNPKTDMNIVLKKDKKDGFFGKFGGGYGTDKRYAADGMITYFSPKTQVSVVGALNNVNKTANDVRTLMEFNSFKGEGLNNDYHSDFTKQGLNILKAVGVTFSQDFSRDADMRQPYFKTNILKSEFFLSDAANKDLRQSQTTVSLGGGNNLLQTDRSANNGDTYSQRSSANYDKRFEHSSLSASFNLTHNSNNSINTQNSTSVNDLTQEQTTNFAQQNATSSQTNVNGSATLNTNRFYDFGKHKMKSVETEISYSFDINNGKSGSKNITDFKATDTTQNKYFNRQYLSDWNSSNHTIATNFKNIVGLLQRNTPYIQTDIKNTIGIYDYKETRDVGDLAIGGTLYTPNTGLTNVSHYKTIDERPGINFSKNFYKSLDNRFQKSWSINMFAESQIFLLRNTALQTFQDINRSYYYFIPSANISYNNYQYGDFEKSYSISYNTWVQYPTIAQLAPLIDNADVYNVPLGNLGLKPAVKHELSFRYNYYDQGNKNALYSGITISAGLVEKNITDSTNYDALGRTVRRYINGADSKYINYNGYINKSFKFKDHQFQINGNSNTGYSQYNTSVNGQYYNTRTTSLSLSSTVTYSYKSIWSTDLGEGFSGNKTSQGSLSHQTYYNWSTNLGFNLALPKSVFFNTRVNFNNSKSSGAADNVYYTIWNADIGYRFLKGANAEVKFSALDLLHQNKNVFNYVNNNSITTGTVNVLQQYFMVTLAYYPRKFGLHKKK